MLLVGGGRGGVGGFRALLLTSDALCLVLQVAGQTLFPCSLCSWVVGVDYTGEVYRGGSGGSGDDVCREEREKERGVNTSTVVLTTQR